MATLDGAPIPPSIHVDALLDSAPTRRPACGLSIGQATLLEAAQAGGHLHPGLFRICRAVAHPAIQGRPRTARISSVSYVDYEHLDALAHSRSPALAPGNGDPQASQRRSRAALTALALALLAPSPARAIRHQGQNGRRHRRLPRQPLEDAAKRFGEAAMDGSPPPPRCTTRGVPCSPLAMPNRPRPGLSVR